ncbi:MAG: hypothetical protein AB7G93_01345 [Bdellovibrionales bacterium]
MSMSMSKSRNNTVNTNNKSPFSRRDLFKTGIGVAGALVATRSVAQVCDLTTGEQPLGPFFPRAGTPEDPIRESQDPTTPIHLANDNDLTFVRGRAGIATGQRIYVRGKVTNEACQPLAHATLIIWQASASGRYNHTGDAENADFRHPLTGETVRRVLDPAFQYWGRTATDENGEYTFKTVVPGFYPADLRGGWYRPPHIHFLVSATGYPQFVTQMYFRGEAIADNDWIQELNRRDALLQSPQLTDAQREELVVHFKEDPTGAISDGLVGQFDITLKR